MKTLTLFIWVILIIAWAGFRIYSALSKENCDEITRGLAILQLIVMLIFQLLD